MSVLYPSVGFVNGTMIFRIQMSFVIFATVKINLDGIIVGFPVVLIRISRN